MSRSAAAASLAGILVASSGCADAWYMVRGTVGSAQGSAIRPLTGAAVELTPPPGQAAPSDGPSCTGPESKAATRENGWFLVVQHCYGVLRARCAPCDLAVSAPGYETRVVEIRRERSSLRPCPPEEDRIYGRWCREIDVVLEPRTPARR